MTLPISVAPQEWAIIQGILKDIVPHRTVWAFGSRARFAAKPYSDLDLAVVGVTPLSLEESARLHEAFTQSDLPYKVDVVDWASTSPEFQAVIAQHHVVVRPADPLPAPSA
ncbi:MAG: nucleotidyltransferase domain-containing protein [Betaproteobacteria bacterium]|nr:nucleotidyltransferase domain-containing protein [Betaproteobacteria bacterium]